MIGSLETAVGFCSDLLRDGSGFTWTWTTPLGKFLAEAERRYGPRDPSYTPIGIEFRGDFPQAWYPGKVRHVSILLSARLSKLQMSVFRDLRRRLQRRESSFEPSLTRPAKVPPTGPGWIHEIKHDGFPSWPARTAPAFA